MDIKQIVLGIIASLVLLGSGFYLGRGQQQIIEKERIVKGDTQIVERVVTVTKTVQPDGTITETTKTEDRTIDKEKIAIDKSKEVTPIENEWGVGVGVVAKLNSVTFRDGVQLPEHEYYLNISRRIIGDVWVEAQGTTDKQLAGGVRVEF